MSERPERALLITRNLPPVIGGMERLIGHIADTLANEHEAVIVGPRGARLQKQPTEFYGCPLSPPSRFLASAAIQARNAARRYRPDFVLAGSGLAAPLARLAARKPRVPFAVYLHGLDIAAPHPLYRRLFLPAIRRADLLIANSRHTAELATNAGVPETALHILHPGVEVPAAIPGHGEAAEELRRYHALPAGPILLATGRLTPRKGFSDFVARSLPAILEAIPDAQLVVAGEVPRHAAQRSGDEAEAIRRAASAAGIAGHVHLIGPLDDSGLARAWPAAGAHVFPVRDDPADPEGFGMVALEAAAWGVPSVAFAAGGVPEAVSHGRSGYLVPAGDHGGFARATIRAVQTRAELSPGAREFAENFAWPRFENRLLQLLDGLR